MKKISLLLCMLMTAAFAFGQVCTPDVDATDPEGNGEIWPPFLKPAYTCESTYDQSLTILVPTDTTILPLITCTVNSYEVHAFYVDSFGTPSPFALGCNPADCILPGGASTCVNLSGDPSVLAPGSVEIYQDVTADLSCPLLGDIVTRDTTFSGYTLDILDCPDCAATEAPISPQTLVRPTTEVIELSWSRVVGSFGYQICGGPIPAEGCLTPNLGETNITRTVPFGALDAGVTYRWRVAAGCGPLGPPITPYSAYDTFDSPVMRLAAQQEAQLETSLVAYPNPASEYIFMSYEAAVEATAQVRIYDMQGRLYMEEPAQVWPGANYIRYDLDGFTTGNYILEVQVGDATETLQFSVDR